MRVISGAVNMFVASVGKLIPDYTASHPKKQNLSVKEKYPASLNTENEQLMAFTLLKKLCSKMLYMCVCVCVCPN
jgi:hypothetical protein